MALRTCFVCNTPDMTRSKNGVTCGDDPCDINLVDKLEELQQRDDPEVVNQIRRDLGETSRELEALKEELDYPEDILKTVRHLVSTEVMSRALVKALEDYKIAMISKT